MILLTKLFKLILVLFKSLLKFNSNHL